MRALRLACALVLAAACPTPSPSSKCDGKVCAAAGSCHAAGSCDPATGECTNPAADDGTPCSDGDGCTTVDVCRQGVCVGTQPIVCTPKDECHAAGVCDPASAACSDPPAGDGTSCTGGLCRGGVCIATAGCSDRTADGEETDMDCGGPACAPCVDGKGCAAPRDCISGNCASGHCAPAVTALVADPGGPLTVASGAHVVLDGTRSRSRAGGITYAWLQTSGPSVALSGAATGRPEFDAPAVGAADALLAFELDVRDGAGAAASAALEVTVLPAGGAAETTATGLILQDMDEGRLDRDTAVEYLAFALFGDSRLPAQYQGADPEPSGSLAMSVISSEFATLSPAAQEVVGPFLLPPSAPGSWFAQRSAQVRAATRGAPAPSGPVYSKYVESEHVVIWYLDDIADGESTATALSNEIEATVWPRLTALWGDRMAPVDDAPVIFFIGIHGKLNIFLTRGLADYGLEHPYYTPPAASYVLIREGLPLTGQPGLREVAAHEIMHSCQDAYAHEEDYKAARWLFEGTATWAEDYVYPASNSEQKRAPYYFNDTARSFEVGQPILRSYAAYLFFQWVTHGTEGPAFIKRAFENLAHERALPAADDAFSTVAGYHFGFQYMWGDFLESAWNRDPQRDFWKMDDLEKGAKPVGGEPVPVEYEGSDTAWEMPVDLPHLSGAYFDFTFPQEKARSLFLFDGVMWDLQVTPSQDGTLLINPGLVARTDTVMRVEAKRGDSWEHEEAPPAPLGFLFCRDDPDETFQELAVIFGDPTPTPGHTVEPQGLPPRLFVTDIGCWRWDGEITGERSLGRNGLGAEKTVADVTLELDPSSYFTGLLQFRVRKALFTWEVTGTVDNCTWDGRDQWSFDADVNPESARPQGGFAYWGPALAGPGYRTYFVIDQGDHQSAYTKSCVQHDGSVQVTHGTERITWWHDFQVNEPTWKPSFSGDGRVMDDSADDGDKV